MKRGGNLVRFSASFILGFVIASGLFALGGSRKLKEESLVYSEIAASLGKNVVALNRLNSNDIAGARFVLETSVDGGIIALHFREAEARLDDNQKRVLEIAKDYRRNHLFVSTNRGVIRRDGVEELLEEITRK